MPSVRVGRAPAAWLPGRWRCAGARGSSSCASAERARAGLVRRSTPIVHEARQPDGGAEDLIIGESRYVESRFQLGHQDRRIRCGMAGVDFHERLRLCLFEHPRDEQRADSLPPPRAQCVALERTDGLPLALRLSLRSGRSARTGTDIPATGYNPAQHGDLDGALADADIGGCKRQRQDACQCDSRGTESEHRKRCCCRPGT